MKNFYHKNFEKKKLWLERQNLDDLGSLSKKTKLTVSYIFTIKISETEFFREAAVEPISTPNFPIQLRKIVAQFHFAI